MTTSLLLAAVVLLIATAARAARDAQDAGANPLSSLGPWWDKSVSWKRKYRNYPTDMRPAFPGATTWAVWLTDWYHFSQFISTRLLLVAVVLIPTDCPLWLRVLAVVPSFLAFELLFRWFRRS